MTTTVTVSVSDVDDATADLTFNNTLVHSGGTDNSRAQSASARSPSPEIPPWSRVSHPINLKVEDSHGAITNATVTITVNKETAETTYTGRYGCRRKGPKKRDRDRADFAAHLTQDGGRGSGRHHACEGAV